MKQSGPDTDTSPRVSALHAEEGDRVLLQARATPRRCEVPRSATKCRPKCHRRALHRVVSVGSRSHVQSAGNHSPSVRRGAARFGRAGPLQDPRRGLPRAVQGLPRGSRAIGESVTSTGSARPGRRIPCLEGAARAARYRQAGEEDRQQDKRTAAFRPEPARHTRKHSDRARGRRASPRLGAHLVPHSSPGDTARQPARGP